MDEYATIILRVDERNVEEHLKIAQYYEGKKQWGKAAVHYDKSEQYTKALKLYIEDGEKNIPNMIDMVGRVKIDALTHELVDYLMGEKGDGSKPPQFIFKLYIMLGKIGPAEKIAINMATQEQELGNYPEAHAALLETFRELRASKTRISFNLNNKLMLVHSFILAKRLIKMNDHLGAARLLIRVSNNIS